MNANIYSLILDAKQGNLKALEQLYITYKDKVYALALTTTKSAGEAEEATRLTFMQMCDQIGTLADPDSFDVWLQYIALNESNALHRSSGHPIEGEAPGSYEQRIEDDFFLPREYSERHDLSYRLRLIIESLPKIRRQTLILSLYNKLTPAEIAQIMGCPEDQVISRIRCTKGHIKTEIENREHETGEHFSNAALIPFSDVYASLIHSRVMSAQTAATIWEQIRAYAESRHNKTDNKRKISVGVKAAIIASIATIVICAGILALLLMGPKFSSDKAVASEAAETTAVTEAATQAPAATDASATDTPAEKTPAAPDPEPAPEENAAPQSKEPAAPASAGSSEILSEISGKYYMPQSAGYTHVGLIIENGTVTQTTIGPDVDHSTSADISSVSADSKTVYRIETTPDFSFNGPSGEYKDSFNAIYYGADTPMADIPSTVIQHLSGFNQLNLSGETLGFSLIVDDHNLCYVRNN